MAADPCRYHFLEPGMAREHVAFISDRAPVVWERLSAPGGGGPLVCLSAVNVWAAEFRGAGVVAIPLGRTLDTSTWVEGGGYRLSGESVPRDHHWLAIGDENSLFDPTGAQFAPFGGPQLVNYIVADGRSFVAWRATNRAASERAGHK